MMPHIVAYVGSRNPESRTCQAITMVKGTLDGIMPVEWTILTPNDTVILPVDGTAREFHTGIDHVEMRGNDDSTRLKSLFEQCDYLILGSPTYGHNVSGDMKNLMDRLTYWGHLFHLANKPGRAFVSATTNGFLTVGGMLEQFMETLGIAVDDTTYNTTYDPFDEHQAKLLADDIATTLKNLPKHPAFNPSSGQEMMFNAYRQQFVRRGKTDYEYRYWKEHGLFTCDTLHDYFVRISRDPRLNAMTAPLMGRRQSNEEGTGK